MLPDEIAGLVRRLEQFLEAAIVARDPRRDIEESNRICQDMLRLLDASGKWEETLVRIAASTASPFSSRPETWPMAAKIASIYLRNVDVSDHSRVGRSKRTQKQSEEIRAGDDREFLRHFVIALMRNASVEQRIAFYGALDDWDAWRVLGQGLGELPMTAQELAALLHHLDRFAREDLARGLVLEGIMTWAGQHPEVVKKVIEGWLAGDARLVLLDHNALEHLVEVVVVRHGWQPDVAAWRDDVINSLEKRNDEASWKLAALLACFAWPKDPVTSAATRHALLLQHVKRSPGRLAVVGLQAMIRDARSFPVESIKTTMALLQLGESHLTSSEDLRRHPRIVARIADQATRGLKSQQQDMAQVEVLFPVLRRVAPSETRPALGLDSFLTELWSSKPTVVREFVEGWLETHADTLHREVVVSLEDVFPTLAHLLGPHGEAQWLVRFMVSASAKLRTVGAILLGARRRGLPLEDAFKELTDDEAIAFAHQIVGVGTLGKTWVPALFRLARTRPGALDVIQRILIDEAAPSYRATCEASLKLWPDATGDEGADGLARARREIERRLADLDRAGAAKAQISELVSTRPADDAWRRMEHRMMEASVVQARKKSLFAALTVQIPIARGGETVMTSGHDEPTRMEKYVFSMELPLLEVLDPLGGRLSRYHHLQEAERIIARSKGDGA